MPGLRGTGGKRVVHRHILKLNERFALEILREHKRFEVRFNDRCFQRGDEVKFRIVNNDGEPVKNEIAEELEGRLYRITFVVSGYGLKEGYVAFGFEEIEEG